MFDTTMPHAIRYRVTHAARDDHERLVAELAGALAATPVSGLRYEIFRYGDGLDYLHLVEYDKSEHGSLRRPASLAEFHLGLRQRCEAEPRREELERLTQWPASPPEGRTLSG